MTNFAGFATKRKHHLIVQNASDHFIANASLPKRLMSTKLGGFVWFVPILRNPKNFKGIYNTIHTHLSKNQFIRQTNRSDSHEIVSVFSREYLVMLPKIMEHTWKEQEVCYNLFSWLFQIHFFKKKSIWI